MDNPNKNKKNNNEFIFPNIFTNNGIIDITAKINGTNIKNITKYHATLFNPFIDNTFNKNVTNKIINNSKITSFFGILLTPIKRRNKDNDKYTIATLLIFNCIIY